MQNNIDKEYLSKDLLPNVHYKISADCVSIYNEHTSWCNVIPVKHIKRTDLDTLYEDVLGYVRLYKQKTKVSYKEHIRKQIETMYPVYKKEYDNAVKLYGRIIKQAKVVQERGIHYGCADDVELIQLTKLKEEYARIYWRSSAYSRILHIYKYLNEVMQYLKVHGADDTVPYMQITL